MVQFCENVLEIIGLDYFLIRIYRIKVLWDLQSDYTVYKDLQNKQIKQFLRFWPLFELFFVLGINLLSKL